MQSTIDVGRQVKLLEQQNRWLRRSLAAVLVVACVVLCGGMIEDEHGELTATKVTLVDPHGAACAWLEVTEEGFPQLRFRKQGSHLNLALGEHAAYLASGSSGQGVSYVGVNKEGPYLNFRGSNLKNGTWLGVKPDGATGLHLYGETLRVGAAVRVESDGTPVLRLSRRTGELITQLPE